MSSSGRNLESYLIPLEEINRATENFSQQRCIGGGGFGEVYKGQLSERWQNQTVAIKRLGLDSRQGEHEFRNELAMISRFHHDNIISFIGYCDQGEEMIIVYHYAVNGSLDHHLQDPNKMSCITWIQRLRICVGAARGLGYLHSGLEEHNRVIHRDIKSGNILLDENLVAKVCDFGLSKLGPKNLPNTHMFTRVAGTQFYLDPTYHESRILRKESDVYSFGVVLFEMLSGMLVYSERTTEDDRSEILMTSVRRHNQNEPDKLIDPDIKLQMDTRSFDLFIQIAYQCISFNFKDRPRMETVIVTLEEALNIQENAGPVIEFISEDMGFSFGKPVAAFTIYKCLLNWNYLEAEGTTIFDRLIQLIMKAYEDLHKYDYMAFWLSNTSTLLFLIRKSLEVHGASSVASSVAQLLGRVKRGLGHKLDEDNAELNVVKHIEGKNPAFVFMQQLTTCVDKIYQIICDSMKKELQPLLAFYIQAPAATVYKDSPLYREHVIYAFLKVLLGIFKKKFVPPVMVQMIFAQIFSYIDDEILKSMLSLKCVEYRNVEYIMAALAELEQWCSEAGNEYARLAWEIPMLTRRVISEVIEEREKRKVFHSFTLYLKASEIINQKGGWVRKEANDGSKSIEILHTKSRIHFSIDDLFTSLQVKDFAKVKPVVELSNYGGFRLKIGHKHIMFGHGIE